MRQAYRFELDPTNVQQTALLRNVGLARFAWNWGLARCKAALEAGEMIPSWVDLINEWNGWKRDAAPWTLEVSKEVPEQAFRNLGRAVTGWREKRVRFPRFKKRGRGRESFRVARPKVELGRVRIPRLGWVRTKEPTGKLDGRVTSAAISRVADRWFVSFAVERDRMMPPARTGEAVGVDLGLKAFATLSDGTVIPNPAPLKTELAKLRRLNQSLSRKQKGSANHRKAAMRLARHHARIANVRRDFLHKLTTELTKTKSVLVVEDLHIRGLIRNHTVARSIGDAGWAEFRRQLEYKAEWYGATVIVAPRFMASSKTCSECGAVKPMPLSERTYRCEECGLVMDRDLNAARNLALSVRVTACGDDVRPACSGAVVREAGTEQLAVA